MSRRFWTKVDRSDPAGCWPWTGQRDRFGYGRFKVDGRNIAAHRFAWTEEYGRPAAGLHLRNTCGQAACCRPHHWRIRERR